jgi:hypothetical protein
MSGIGITSYGALRSNTRAEEEKIGTSSDYKLKAYAGIKLEGGTPQPRGGEKERPPELTSIHNRAIFTAHGKQIAPLERQYQPDAGSPLGKLLQTVRDQRGKEGALYESCDQGLRTISNAYGALKSPPEFGSQQNYADELRGHAENLRNQAKGFDENKAGDRVKLEGGETLSAKMKSLLLDAARDLEDQAKFRQDLPDRRPTQQSVGHFKAMETEGALRVVQSEIKKMKDAGGRDQDLQVLRDAETYLKKRIDQFEGKGEDAWTGQDPLEKRDMKRLIGEKPGKLDKLLMKIGIGSFASERKAIAKLIGEGNTPPMNSSKASENLIMSMFLAHTLKSANVEGKNSVSDLSKEIHHEHMHVLNKNQEWKTIDKTLTPTYGGKTETFTTQLKPHSNVEGTVDMEPGTGINCHDATNSRAANGYLRTLKDKDGETVFDQVRTGINCAYEIKDTQERKLANLERAKDTIALTICKSANETDGLYSQALKQVEQRNQGQNPEPIVIRQGTISHLTADPLRHLKAGLSMAKDNERMMLAEQYEAQQQLAKSGPIDIKVKGPDGKEMTVKVKYEPIMFGVPVNAGGQTWSMLPGPLGELTSGHWHLEGSYNDESWKQLQGWATEATDKAKQVIRERDALQAKETNGELTDDDRALLADLNSRAGKLQAKIDRVEALKSQVTDLWESKDYRVGGHNPYKLSERLECLIYEVAHLHTTCKSNKDRCSFADAHAMDLMMKMHSTGEVPGPNQPRDREDQVNLRNTVFGCGNSELQTNNVGGAGYKLKGVSQIYTEMGLKENDRGFLGVGEFTAT